MTIDSPTVLLVQNDVTPGREAGFDAWYLADHMPDRVGIPGFRRARRWRAVEGGPRDLGLYEIDGPHVMSEPAYLARLAHPTEGTRRFMDAFIGMRRSVCDVQGAAGIADGGCAALLPITAPYNDTTAACATAGENWRADPDSGVVARAWLRCDQDASRSNSIESRLRKGADQTIIAAIWIETTSCEQSQAAATAAAHRLRAAGLVCGESVLLRLVAAFDKPRQ